MVAEGLDERGLGEELGEQDGIQSLPQLHATISLTIVQIQIQTHTTHLSHTFFCSLHQPHKLLYETGSLE
jgi:hypothetical protein